MQILVFVSLLLCFGVTEARHTGSFRHSLFWRLLHENNNGNREDFNDTSPNFVASFHPLTAIVTDHATFYSCYVKQGATVTTGTCNPTKNIKSTEACFKSCIANKIHLPDNAINAMSYRTSSNICYCCSNSSTFGVSALNNSCIFKRRTVLIS